MSRVERVEKKLKAVLWVKAGVDDYNQVTVSSPVEIDVEWPTLTRVSGESQNSNESKPDTIITNSSMVLGSILWRGNLRDLPSPAVNLELYQITTSSVTPDIKQRARRYSSNLTRFTDTLPTNV
jgi:hypothetical protein